MEKLTLEHIAPYLPYGLKIDTSYYDNEEYSTVVGHNDADLIVWDGQWASTYGKKIEQDYYIEHVKPILRPMNLTQPIIVEGKEIIPIIELAKIAFPNEKTWTIESEEEGIVSCMDFDFGYRDNGFKASGYMYKPVHIPNQRYLFKKLYEWKFDLDNLIEKGIAVDVNTLEANPLQLNDMEITIALEILKQHNLWRRDKEVPSSIKMHNPADIGVAIDTVIEYQSELLRQNREMEKTIKMFVDLCDLIRYPTESELKNIVKVGRDCLTSLNKGKE